MEKVKNKIKHWTSRENLIVVGTLLIAIQPLLDLDYLIYPLLQIFHIPRFATIVRFIVIPLMIVLVLFRFEKKRKQAFLILSIYSVVVLLYFVLHVQNAQLLYDKLNLTTNFYFSLFSELTYLLTLLLPLIYVRVIDLFTLTETIVKKVTIALSCLTAIPIFIGNLFVFGKSTYSGYTTANFLAWFNGAYDVYHPRELASKFYFSEGNTMGILLLMILPLLYYFFYKAMKKERRALCALIIIHSIAMIMISTRVGTYGAILVPIAMLVLYGVMLLFRKEKLQWQFPVGLLVIIVLFTVILPYTPAHVNQTLDAEIHTIAVNSNVQIIEEQREIVGQGKDLVPGSVEYNYFYIHIFEDNMNEDNAYLLAGVPKQYYTLWYHYTFDPKFWVDLIFNYTLEERANGRVFENIFMNYKWQNLDLGEKMLGMGYSTFMFGSIVLEQDFKQQIYTFGYVGFVLLVLPWLFILGSCGILMLRHFKEHFNFKMLTMAMAVVIGMISGYVSGHTLDQFLTSMFLALLLGYGLSLLKKTKVCDEDVD